MSASYRDAVRAFVSLVVNQRDELLNAIRDDASPKARQRRDEFIRERQRDQRGAGSNAAGFRVPGGETTRLLAEFDPGNEVGEAQRAFHAANVAVADAGLGAHFLPMLKSVREAHADLCRNARLAFEASASQVSGDILHEHGRAISELLDGVGWDEADQPENVPTNNTLQDGTKVCITSVGTTPASSPELWAVRLRGLQDSFRAVLQTSRLECGIVQAVSDHQVDLQREVERILNERTHPYPWDKVAWTNCPLDENATRWISRATILMIEPPAALHDPALPLVEQGNLVLTNASGALAELTAKPLTNHTPTALWKFGADQRWLWMLFELAWAQPALGIAAEQSIFPPHGNSDDVIIAGFTGGPRPTWWDERPRSFDCRIQSVAAASVAAIDGLFHLLEVATSRPATPNVPQPLTKTTEREPNHPDGPEDPYWLWWNSKRHKVGSNRARRTYDLLTFFWNRESATFQELTGPGKPWTEAVQDHAFSNAASNFNNDMPRGFPWRLRTGGRRMFKEKISLES